MKLTSRSPTDPSKEIETEVSGKELAEGLQYGPTAGIPSLIDWVYGLQERNHGRKKGEGWRVSIGSGSQDVIYKVTQQNYHVGFGLAEFLTGSDDDPEPRRPNPS